MKRPSGTLSASQLRERIRGVEVQIEGLQRQEDEIARRRTELKIKLDTLTELVQHLRPDTNGNGHGGDHRLPALERIIAYVAANPGVRPKDVVDALVDQIPTKAANPRKNIHQMILNLKNGGRLETSDGGLRVVSTTAGAR